MFMDGPTGPDDADVGLNTFDVVVEAVRRCIDAGRFDPGDPLPRAVQLWGLVHGLVALHIAHLLPAEEAITSLRDAASNLFLAFGDTADIDHVD